MNDWFVYLIRTENNALYTGITTDIERRLYEHRNSNTKGAKYFRGKKQLTLVFAKVCKNQSEAATQEAKIKRLRKLQKEQLIESSENEINLLVNNDND